MDELLQEFLAETGESLDLVDAELVRFEQEPNNAKILDNIFRLVHTIKGTCGFIGLPRLAALAHAAETLMSKFRDGMPVSAEAVTLILRTLDRLKAFMAELERRQCEPEGTDDDLIGELERMARQSAPSKPGPQIPGTLSQQMLEQAVRAGDVTLDDLERAFREAPPEQAKSSLSASALSGFADMPRDRDEDEKAGQHSIRVNLETLDKLMTMVSELVLTRNQLLDIVRHQPDSEFQTPLQRLSTVTAELQEGVTKTRMQPIGQAWQKLPRVVRDLANELGKDIELEMHGAETELDRQVLERIRDPLTHMVRNSADHGLETPAERRIAGKPEKGTIRLSAYQQGGHIIVSVADDGRGLDIARIRQKALANGLVSEAELARMTPVQIQNFIFAPGFSTAAEVTNVSGRGVGMDVVRNNIDQIGGAIDVRSVPGQGLTFTVKIPLTLAIASALIVEAGGHRFAIPQLAVVELVRIHAGSEQRIEHIRDAAVLRLRDRLLPMLNLRAALELGGEESTSGKSFVVVMHVGAQAFGVVVDGVFHTEEIVVKPMSSKLRHIGMFAGNTILGDGSVIMILDPSGIAQSLGAAVATGDEARADADAGAEHDAAARNTTAVLVVRAGSSAPKAVPLSLVTRLEEVDCGAIEFSNGRHLVQYRGHLMPLVPVNEHVRLKQQGAQPLVVFSDAGRSMGLVVDEIVDIVEEQLDIQVGSQVPGIIGSAVIKGQATEILDVGYFLPLAYDDWFHRENRTVEDSARTLLFVDDSAFFRNMLTPVLKAAGYDVTTVGGAEEALALLRSGRTFDVLVTDLDMPGMDGFALAEAVRHEASVAGMPIIALSSLGSPESIERGRAAGFRDHVAKFDRQSLVTALKERIAEVGRAA